jgi:dolichyl-phosphate-mannose--protein O-mannosyl transferase
VLLSAGGPSVTRTLAMHLFSRVSEFNPWAMCLVLQIVSSPLTASSMRVTRILFVICYLLLVILFYKLFIIFGVPLIVSVL